MSKTPSSSQQVIAESDEIADLLAELMPDARTIPVRPKSKAPAAPPAKPPIVEAPPTRKNGRKEQPLPQKKKSGSLGVGQKYEGPFPAPIGVLPFAEFMALINWRNQPGDLKALPLLGKPHGHEWTVAAVLSEFAWD